VSSDEIEPARARLGQLAGADQVEVSDAAGGWITVRIPAGRASEVNRALAGGGIYAARLEAGSDLEELFLSLTADESASHEGTFQGISTASSEQDDPS
jgi:hypothetical protein